MNWNKACELLDVPIKHTEIMLKKAYYKKALKYHPDKNKSKNAEETFKKINTAYSFLRNYYNDIRKEDEMETNYKDIIKNCVKYFTPEIKWDDIFLDTTLNNILNNCEKISLQLFNDIKKEKSIELFTFLSKHRDIFGLSDSIIEKMKKILQEKMRDDNIIILNPSLKDLLNDNIYKLDFNEKTYYIPLWHNEVVFDHCGNDLIVKCIPDLKDHIKVDNNNNIHCYYEIPITHILKEKKIDITIGDKTFTIQGHKLVIQENQTIILKKKGILRENNDNIFSTNKRGDIYIDIKLESC